MKILIPRAASSRWASAYSSRARRRAECLVSPMETDTQSSSSLSAPGTLARRTFGSPPLVDLYTSLRTTGAPPGPSPAWASAKASKTLNMMDQMGSSMMMLIP
ncbi:MAG: hypothetical protein IKR86_06725 [Candidatus Methanomethylophilaceae archaeon]|nr:hypothetical protein [Candidatus Methanomethylophilaceae archaeon]